MSVARRVATVLGLGDMRRAPGTWGSLVALSWGWLIHVLLGFPALVLITALAFFAGWWATARMTEGADDPDPANIVVDEVVGQWIAIFPLSFAAAQQGLDILTLWPGWIAAFGLFRLFDIWKPGPVGWADRRGDALGVMLDDVIAGVLAALGVLALAWLAHSGVLGQ